MCRLFGFRSLIPSQVHRSLVAAENALGRQSEDHSDGWGVAFYIDGTPHVTRSPTLALGDALFHRLSGVVSSETVLAHVRKATRGANNVLNCHPFQYGRWVFAHNGDVPGFEQHRRKPLLAAVAPALRRFILGETDSELLFHLFLTHLSRQGPLSKSHDVATVAEALSTTMQEVRKLCSSAGESGEPLLLTCMVTDGTTLVARHGGKELYWSSYKTRCADRGTCPSLAPECEAPTTTGFVNHLIISSEPLQGENVWHEMVAGELIGVDWRMKLYRLGASRAQPPESEPPRFADGAAPQL